MKLTREMFTTAAYVLGKRIQGYTLLKNPKGANPNDVSMIKTSFALDYRNSDDIFSYTKIQRQKINGKLIETKRTLLSTHYLDSTTKQMTNKKRLSYAEYDNNDNLIKCANRLDLSEAELKKRPKPKWKKTKNRFDGSKDEEIQYWEKRFDNEYNKSFYQPPVSIFERILTLGQYKLFRNDNRPFPPGFIKTLIVNLKGG